MTLVAKVRFNTSLPQLDKEFDYLIPDNLAHLEPGFQVKVPFGSQKEKIGLVTSIEEESSTRENLLPISSLDSLIPVLTTEQLNLCVEVSKRQAGSVGELLDSAVPKRFKRIEKQFTASNPDLTFELGEFDSENQVHFEPGCTRAYLQPKLITGSSALADWVEKFIVTAMTEFKAGRSSLVVLPDYADLEKFEEGLEAFGVKEISFRHSSLDTGSDRHLNHLKAVSRVGINYGQRGASFAPAKNLGLIMVWDDGDDSHTEQTSPYWHSRDVALQRAELERAKLLFSSHSPSAEVVRLIEIGYIKHLKSKQSLPNVRLASLNDRIDAKTFSLMKDAIGRREPVLVQIANAGWASSLVCTSCKSLRTCKICDASIWIDPSGQGRCRNCKKAFPLEPCDCGKSGVRPTRLGSNAIAKQLQQSFPNTPVLHSNGESRLLRVDARGSIIVATTGAEPQVPGGYSIVLLADSAYMTGSPRLRALEQSSQKWANAVSLASKNATVVFVGITGVLAKQLEQLDFYSIVRTDSEDRRELGLPPFSRLASVESSNATDHQLLLDEVASGKLAGETQLLNLSDANTLAFTYSYSSGQEVAESLKSICQELAKKSKTKKPGERVFRINMDDSKVI